MKNPLSKKLALIARAETILLRLRLRDLLIAFACLCSALCFLLIGLLVSHVATFMALRQRLGGAGAGAVIAGFDFIFALGLMTYALKEKKGGKDRKIAREARDLTLEALQTDMARMSEEFVEFRSELRQLRHLFSQGAAAFSWVVSLSQLFFDLVKTKSRAKPRGKASDQGQEPSTSKHSDSSVS